MLRFNRTLVRITLHNRIHLDRLRRHKDCSRDKLVNRIVAEYLESICEEHRTDRRRRRVA